MANNSGRKRRFGATRQLPSGRWQIRYPDPVTKQLRPGEKTFATKTDAEVALSVIEADMVRGKWSDPDSGKITLTEYSDTWIKERQLAATSRDRNEGVLRLHILPKLGASGLNEISTPRIRSWRAGLLESGVGAPTVVKAYQILRAIMNTAVDDGDAAFRDEAAWEAGGGAEAVGDLFDAQETFGHGTPSRWLLCAPAAMRSAAGE